MGIGVIAWALFLVIGVANLWLLRSLI